MKGLEFPVGIAIDVGISTGNLVDWSRDLGGMSVGPVCSQSRNSSLFSCLPPVRTVNGTTSPKWEPKETRFWRFFFLKLVLWAFCSELRLTHQSRIKQNLRPPMSRGWYPFAYAHNFYFELAVWGSIQEAKYSHIWSPATMWNLSTTICFTLHLLIWLALLKLWLCLKIL